MTALVRLVLGSALVASLLVASPRVASADAGDSGDSGDSDAAPETPAVVRLACDGSLCDTTNDATCAASPYPGGAALHAGAVLAFVGGLGAVAGRRRRRRERPKS